MPLAPMAVRRISAELQEWQRAAPDGWQLLSLGGPGGDDVSVWNLRVTGDAGTLYEGEEYDLTAREERSSVGSATRLTPRPPGPLPGRLPDDGAHRGVRAPVSGAPAHLQQR